jgi:hypothetical protein
MVWSLALVVAAHPLFFVIAVGIERQLRSWDLELQAASAATSIIFATGWLLIWRKAVRWTLAVRFWTLLTLLIAVAGGSGTGVGFRSVLPWGDLGWLIGTWFGGAIWIAGTAFVWGRPALGLESTAEGAKIVVRCPKCDYDLRGARELRCPECGSELQLADLVARALLDVVTQGQLR